MSADMTEKLFEKWAYGKAALKKMGDVPENFRLYVAGWKGKHPNYHGMSISGAEFAPATRGPRKGRLTKKVEGSDRTAYVTVAEINAERDD